MRIKRTARVRVRRWRCQAAIAAVAVAMAALVFPSCRTVATPPAAGAGEPAAVRAQAQVQAGSKGKPGADTGQDAREDPIAARKVLRVGVATDRPPLAYRWKRKLTGAEPQFAGMLGEALKLPVEIKEMKREKLIPALKEGKIDIIMAGMTMTSGNTERVAFAKPYLVAGQMLLVRERNAIDYQYPPIIEMTWPRVGVEEGTAGDDYVRRRCRRATRVPFKKDSLDKAASALFWNKIDVFVHDAPVVWSMAIAHPAKNLVVIWRPLVPEHVAWAVRKDDPALLEAANAALAKWKADGALREVLERWIPRPDADTWRGANE